ECCRASSCSSLAEIAGGAFQAFQAPPPLWPKPQWAPPPKSERYDAGELVPPRQDLRERESFPARNAERSGSSSPNTGDGERRPVRRAAALGPRSRSAQSQLMS